MENDQVFAAIEAGYRSGGVARKTLLFEILIL